MKTTDSKPFHTPGLVLLTALGSLSATALAADPTDAAAPVPQLMLDGTLAAGKAKYLEELDAPRVKWSTLFSTDGRFASQSGARITDKSMPAHSAGSMQGHSMTGHSTTGHSMPAEATSMAGTPGAPAAMATTGSDAQGEIKALYPDTGKIKIKHGPIDRHDMPGMTMIFRVRDPALFTQVAPGDKVGFTMEIDRGAMVVTGFQKAEGAQ